MDQTTDERIWSYVLGGMNDQDREAMERSMQDDPALRDRVKKAEQAGQMYRTLIPCIDTDVDMDTLVEKIIKGWEQSEGINHTGPSDVQGTALRPSAPVESTPPKQASTPFVRRTLLAMAACMVVLVSIPSLFAPDTLEWMEPRLVVLKYKGWSSTNTIALTNVYDETSTKARYTKETFAALSSELRTIIKREYATHRAKSVWNTWLRWHADWRLQIQIQELFDGILQVQVAAYGEDPLSPTGTWMEYAESVDSFRSQIQSFGTKVAKELARLNHEPT